MEDQQTFEMANAVFAILSINFFFVEILLLPTHTLKCVKIDTSNAKTTNCEHSQLHKCEEHIIYMEVWSVDTIHLNSDCIL